MGGPLGFPHFCADIRAFDTLVQQGARAFNLELLSAVIKKEGFGADAAPAGAKMGALSSVLRWQPRF
jgi:hypothetical protein